MVLKPLPRGIRRGKHLSLVPVSVVFRDMFHWIQRTQIRFTIYDPLCYSLELAQCNNSQGIICGITEYFQLTSNILYSCHFKNREEKLTDTPLT